MDGGYNVACGGHSHCELTLDFLRFFRDFLPVYRSSMEVVSLRLGNRFFSELRWPSKWSLDRETPFEKERILDPEPDRKLLSRAYKLLGETFPALKDVEISQRWAGMIDVTPDELPILSTVDRVPGLVISTGYSGHGFGIVLGAGDVTAALACGNSPKVDISPYSIRRLLKYRESGVPALMNRLEYSATMLLPLLSMAT